MTEADQEDHVYRLALKARMADPYASYAEVLAATRTALARDFMSNEEAMLWFEFARNPD